MSTRKEVALKFVDLWDTAKWSDGNRVFNGPNNDYQPSVKGERNYHTVSLSVARWWDFVIKVFGPKGIYVNAYGGPAHTHREKFTSVDDAIKFIKELVGY